MSRNHALLTNKWKFFFPEKVLWKSWALPISITSPSRETWMKSCISLELHPFPKVFGPFLLPDSKEKNKVFPSDCKSYLNFLCDLTAKCVLWRSCSLLISLEEEAQAINLLSVPCSGHQHLFPTFPIPKCLDLQQWGLIHLSKEQPQHKNS